MTRACTGVRSRTVWVILMMGVSLWTALPHPVVAQVQDETTRKPGLPRTTKSAESQDTAAKLAALERKLDQVLANQQAILQKFDAVMEELHIIKIRASLRN